METQHQRTIRSACVVVPTYNEAENIRPLLDAIYEEERKQPDTKSPVPLMVLVVDDSSPDGTADIVRAYRDRNPDVHLLVRKEKAGLGAAYTAGMRHAIATLAPDVILEMDADFSHNPADIFRLIEEIKRGADFVIGSRYVPGGSVPEDWGVHRKLLSNAANLFSRTVLSIRDVKDCTGGFRAIHRSVIETVDLESLDAKGYVFQVSLLDAALRRGFVVREVPIAFSDRERGKSKMRAKDMFEGGRRLLRIGMDRWLEDGEGEAQAA